MHQSRIIDLVRNKSEIKGLIIVGANKCNELFKYRKSFFEPIVLFEPLPKEYEILRNKSDKIIVHNKAVSDFNGTSNFYIASNSVSSSMMRPKEVIDDQHIQIVDEIEVDVVKLDDFIENKEDFTLLLIDAEGSEMRILKGAIELLKNIDVLCVELNYKENYKGLTLAKEVKEFINSLGFVMVDEKFGDRTKAYTDALYIKSNFQ